MTHTFEDINISTALRKALADLGFERPTPVQWEAFPIIRSGKNVMGVSQTGTGKTLAYLLPILQDLKYSEQDTPRALIIVPTRELVLQVVGQVEAYAKYMNARVLGVYGGANINTQKILVAEGMDILVGTPGRLYDLALSRALKLRDVGKLVIDEVDVMLDLGFRFQLTNIFDLLPERRQNIMFSATMTDEVDKLIQDFFISPSKISIAVSGTPLHNIAQCCYPVPNFYTKVNLLAHLLQDKEEYGKTLVFTASKKSADRLFEALQERFRDEIAIIHSNKSQNYRIRSVRQFDEGKKRILIATDIMARGLDLDNISHVINMDTPSFPENYMHRIGRTGRAEREGQSLLFFTPAEEEAKKRIEELMDYEIPLREMPEEVEHSSQLTPEERATLGKQKNPNRNRSVRQDESGGGAFHEKKEKNKKVNLGGKYHRELGKKYKKPQRRGDKIQNMRKKKKRR